jgi:hypothetical protein
VQRRELVPHRRHEVLRRAMRQDALRQNEALIGLLGLRHRRVMPARRLSVRRRRRGQLRRESFHRHRR